MIFKSVVDSSHDDVTGVCIAIGRENKRKNQQHIGIYYRDSSSNLKLLNLQWHYRIKNDSPSDMYLWLEVPLDDANAIHMATFCELVFNANQNGIPYGICIDGTGFSKKGVFTSDEHFAGLTCATFVIQMFHSQQYFIIDLDKWKLKTADKKWQRQILQKLEKWVAKGRVSVEHMAYQRKMIQQGAARFKPEEVAVAAVMDDPPHGFEILKKPAGQLLNQIIQHATKVASSKAGNIV